MKLATEGHETTSDVVKLAREQVQQTLYIDRVVRENGNFFLSREACVFLKPVASKLSWFYGLNSSSDPKENLP